MPSAYTALKNDFVRIARKEFRAEMQSLKKTSAAYRDEIAALKRNTHAEIAQLKRDVRALEQTVLQLSKPEAGHVRAIVPDKEVADTTRFTRKGLVSHRRRLDLSAEDYGRVLGASGQSVYKWESGKARPRGEHLSALIAQTLGRCQGGDSNGGIATSSMGALGLWWLRHMRPKKRCGL